MQLTDSFHSMGVLNLTPNSFSDGGKLSSLDDVKKQIHTLQTEGCSILDFGAESTAPFNKAVTLEEELDRLESLLYPCLASINPETWISIDTYKTKVMNSLMESGRLKGRKVIFNDVSGSLDDSLEEFLLKYPEVIYVYSHNLSPTRTQTQNHMDFSNTLYGEDLTHHLEQYFDEAKSWFLAKGIQNPLWLDPCFGFSKDYQQNLDLLQFIPRIINQSGPGQTWLLGISKKSFLRQLTAEGLSREEQFQRAEQAHASILTSWMRVVDSQNQVVIRLHDISLFQSVKRCKFMFES